MTNNTAVTIRRATDADAFALRRLAVIDSASPPTGDVLLAEMGDELWAAVSVDTGAAIADPFRPSADLVDLLRLRAGAWPAIRTFARWHACCSTRPSGSRPQGRSLSSNRRRRPSLGPPSAFWMPRRRAAAGRGRRAGAGVILPAGASLFVRQPP